ncbi:Armadillo repeat-containing X-linked protein 5 [Fukomys damarensis]|uniref:Armadillo repeat-containing X-linked protein 5 n=1 Tax=Fukomys damarensis TaxID=885580 RepID=A0A091DZ74_FUKDA|nr:Armadillo repeat-containing X-linked protein 5 [Fukomys damarensis]
MINSRATEQARVEVGDGLKAEISSPENARTRDEPQAMALVEAEPKAEIVTKDKFGDGIMAMTQTVTYTEPVTGTREVNKMETMTDTRVMDETKPELLEELAIVPQTRSKALPMSRFNAITKATVRAASASEASSRSCATADNKANIVSRYEIKEEISIKPMPRNKVGIGIKSTDEDEENICSWFWIGEEPSVGSWFWPKEEIPLQIYKSPPKIQERPKPTHKSKLTIKQKATAWSRARYIVLVPIEGEEQPLPPEGNWTLVTTLIETPLGIRPLTKIPPYNGPYFQTLAEIKKQIRQREKYGPHPRACLCKSHCFSLEPKEFDKLVALLKLTKDPFVHEIATMIMGISPAYPFTQDIIHDVGIIDMIENLINNPDVDEDSGAFDVVDDSSESSEEPKMGLVNSDRPQCASVEETLEGKEEHENALQFWRCVGLGGGQLSLNGDPNKSGVNVNGENRTSSGAS